MLQFIAFLFCIFVIYLGFSEIFNFFAPKKKNAVTADTSQKTISKQPFLWEKNKYTHSGFEVVGESYYQNNIEKIRYRNTILATLIPEKNNIHDPHAVRVDVDGRTVGYLSRDCNQQFRALLLNAGLSSTEPTNCFASVIGGHTKSGNTTSYGIVLDF